MKNEIAIKDRWNALSIADMLLEEEYIVMLSRADEFTILNFEYYPAADRAGVVFMSRDEYEEQLDTNYESLMDDVTKDYIKGTLGSILGSRIDKWKNDISSI